MAIEAAPPRAEFKVNVCLQMKDNSPIVWFEQVLSSDHLARTLAEAFNRHTSEVLQRMGSMVLIQWRGCAELSVK